MGIPRQVHVIKNGNLEVLSCFGESCVIVMDMVCSLDMNSFLGHPDDLYWIEQHVILSPRLKVCPDPPVVNEHLLGS